MPELGLKLGYDLTPNLRLYAGYDFLFISSVVRPGNQIDLNVNRTQVPNVFGPQALIGPALPAPQFNPTTFWVQGFNVGLQVIAHPLELGLLALSAGLQVGFSGRA